MVVSGWATSRADAVRKGRRLVRARYIHHVVNNHDFCDGLLFFRFYADEASRYSYKFWAEQSPEEAAADPRKFRFEPHTVANSLVLTVPLAKQLEAVVVRAPPSVVQGMFRVVRQRVLDVSRADGVWVKSMSLSGGGVDVYRQHVDSAYPAIKTVFEIGVKPAQYFRAWLDLNARTHLEPCVSRSAPCRACCVAHTLVWCTYHHARSSRYLVEALHVDVVPKMQDRMSFRHIPMYDGGSTPSAAPGDSAANPGGSPTGGSAAGGDGEGDTIATAPSTGASRRSSRATTPPPRLPSRSKVPSFTAVRSSVWLCGCVACVAVWLWLVTLWLILDRPACLAAAARRPRPLSTPAAHAVTRRAQRIRQRRGAAVGEDIPRRASQRLPPFLPGQAGAQAPSPHPERRPPAPRQSRRRRAGSGCSPGQPPGSSRCSPPAATVVTVSHGAAEWRGGPRRWRRGPFTTRPPPRWWLGSGSHCRLAGGRGRGRGGSRGSSRGSGWCGWWGRCGCADGSLWRSGVGPFVCWQWRQWRQRWRRRRHDTRLQEARGAATGRNSCCDGQHWPSAKHRWRHDSSSRRG